MSLQANIFPAITSKAFDEGYSMPDKPVGYDASIITAQIAAGLSPILYTTPQDCDVVMPNAQGDSVVGRPVIFESLSDLRDVVIHCSSPDSMEIHVLDCADSPCLPPGDAITGEATGWVSGAAPAAPVYVGIGIYAFPIFDDGFSPRAINYVPRLDTEAGFPLYTAGSIFGWFNDLQGTLFGNKYPGISIHGYSDLGYSRWGINSAYNNGSPYLGGFAMMPNHVIFGFDADWSIVEKVKNNIFSAEIAADVDQRIADISRRRVVGYAWVGHGYWSGSNPTFVGLGRTFGATRRQIDQNIAAPELLRLPLDYSALFRAPTVSGSQARLGNLGSLGAGEKTNTFLIKTSREFSGCRGLYYTYTEV